MRDKGLDHALVKSHGHYGWIWIVLVLAVVGVYIIFVRGHQSAAPKEVDLDISSMRNASSLHLVGDTTVEKGPLRTNFARAVIANGAQYAFHDVQAEINLYAGDPNSKIPVNHGSVTTNADSIEPGAQWLIKVPIEDREVTDARVVRILASCDPKAPVAVPGAAVPGQPAGAGAGPAPAPVPALPVAGVVANPPAPIPVQPFAALGPAGAKAEKVVTAPAAPVDPFKDVAAGMTPDEVRALAGPPDKTSTAGIGERQMEWWTYNDGTKLTFSNGHVTDKKKSTPLVVPVPPAPPVQPRSRTGGGLSP
jgi:hypothetical protein